MSKQTIAINTCGKEKCAKFIVFFSEWLKMLISLLIVFKEKSPHVIYCVKLLLIEKCLKINIKIIQLNLESLKCDYFAEFLNTPLMPIRHFIKRLKI